MALASAALMQRRPIFRSSDVDETYAFLNGSGLRFNLASTGRSRLDVQINGVQLRGMYIGYTQYGSPAELRMDPDSASYWIKFPVRGVLAARRQHSAATRVASHCAGASSPVAPSSPG